MASAAFSNRLYRLDCSRLWSDEGLQTFLGSLRGILTWVLRYPSVHQVQRVAITIEKKTTDFVILLSFSTLRSTVPLYNRFTSGRTCSGSLSCTVRTDISPIPNAT